jgi:hypothetical protein
MMLPHRRTLVEAVDWATFLAAEDFILPVPSARPMSLLPGATR